MEQICWKNVVGKNFEDINIKILKSLKIISKWVSLKILFFQKRANVIWKYGKCFKLKQTDILNRWLYLKVGRYDIAERKQIHKQVFVTSNKVTISRNMHSEKPLKWPGDTTAKFRKNFCSENFLVKLKVYFSANNSRWLLLSQHGYMPWIFIMYSISSLHIIIHRL